MVLGPRYLGELAVCSLFSLLLLLLLLYYYYHDYSYYYCCLCTTTIMTTTTIAAAIITNIIIISYYYYFTSRICMLSQLVDVSLLFLSLPLFLSFFVSIFLFFSLSVTFPICKRPVLMVRRDNELSPPEGVASSPRSVASLGQQSTSSSGSVGGPLMSGPITTRGGVSSTGYNDTITLNASSSYASFTLNPGELSLPEFDFFPTSTWDMMGGPDNGNPHTPWGERPDSRQSLTPVSTPTPRPPSVPGYSPACPSPLNPYSVATQPSPAAATTPFVNNFPFSPIQEQSANSSFLEEPKNNKEGVMDGENGTSASGSGGAGGGGNAGPSQESGRLRNLLTKRASTSEEGEFSEETEARNKNRILKGLLNQEEEEEASRPASRVLAGRLPSSDMNKPPTNNNNMLLKVSRLLVLRISKFVYSPNGDQWFKK